MIEKDDPLRLRIEVLRVLARTNQPSRVVLMERNIEDHLKTAGGEKSSLERLRDAIDREDAETTRRGLEHSKGLCALAAGRGSCLWFEQIYLPRRLGLGALIARDCCFDGAVAQQALKIANGSANPFFELRFWRPTEQVIGL